MAIEAVDLDLDNTYTLPVESAQKEGELNGRTVQPKNKEALPVAIANIAEATQDLDETVKPLSEKMVAVKQASDPTTNHKEDDNDNNTQGCGGGC